MNPLILRQPMILTFWLHKSATMYQIYSNSLSIFKSKSLLSKNLKNWIYDCSVAATQTAHMFLGHPVDT